MIASTVNHALNGISKTTEVELNMKLNMYLSHS